MLWIWSYGGWICLKFGSGMIMYDLMFQCVWLNGFDPMAFGYVWI